MTQVKAYGQRKLRLLTLDSLVLTLPLDLDVIDALMIASEDRLPHYFVMLELVSVCRAVSVLNIRYSLVF